MNLDLVAGKYPDFHIEDRSVAITALPGWVWLLSVILVAVPLAAYAWLSSGPNRNFDLGWTWLLFTFVLLLLHEGTHAVAWKQASRLPWSAFKFGVQWKTVTPYCHSTEPMPVRAYRIGALMPLIVTGLIPWIIGLMMGNADVAMAASILISGAAGDLYILWSIRDLPKGVLLQDHDAKAGCIVLWPPV